MPPAHLGSEGNRSFEGVGKERKGERKKRLTIDRKAHRGGGRDGMKAGGAQDPNGLNASVKKSEGKVRCCGQ